MAHRTVITIEWDKRTPPANALLIAEEAATLVMDRLHRWPRMERIYDSDVSATLWEPDAATDVATDPAVIAAAKDYEARVAEGRPYESAEDAEALVAEARRRFG